MRIVHFITSLKIGGAEAALYNFLSYLCENKSCAAEHSVIYIHDGPYVEKIRALGIEVFKLNGVVSPYDPVSFFRLIKILRKLQPSVIHTALWSAGVLARLANPFVKVPIISDLHGDCAYHGRLRNFFEKITVRVPVKFVAVSSGVKKSFCKVFGGAKKLEDRVVVIRNGIDASRSGSGGEITRDSLGLRECDFIFASVGRLNKIKNYDLLIRSFSRLVEEGHKSLRLCLVGDGPERSSLELLVCELGIEGFVLFTGARNDVHSLLPLFDTFVLPSKSEGLSIALLEAMSFGLPIITTGVDSEHEVVANGKNGFVVQSDNEDELTKALEKIYLDRELKIRMGVQSLKIVNEFFQLSCSVRKYFEIYDEVSG